MKTSPLFPPPSCDLHTGSGIGASFRFHQSHRLPMLLHPLRHRGCLYDITVARTCCGWFPVSPPFCVLFQSAFLHVFVTKWHFTNLVDPTIASLTPLLSWLKGAPPGINPSSRQQKTKIAAIGRYIRTVTSGNNESLDSEAQLLARNRVVMSFRLCNTAKLDLASVLKEQRLECSLFRVLTTNRINSNCKLQQL